MVQTHYFTTRERGYKGGGGREEEEANFDIIH